MCCQGKHSGQEEGLTCGPDTVTPLLQKLREIEVIGLRSRSIITLGLDLGDGSKIQTHNHFFIFVYFVLYIPHISEIIQYLSFPVCLIALSTIHSSSPDSSPS